ncbi:hypothetical protein [Pendulispora albinea]|uniref:Uma2 family endonuclease n=1 Tax=Pendulispora albinea TaxID=2741071 RepID=A0ABZ2M495_9BACT
MDSKKYELLQAPGARDEPVRAPRIDERLAPPETRLEYLHGIELFAAPAEASHATRHADIAMVLRASVGPGYTAAVDLLTRTDDASDFAPDASIYPSAPDASGHRRLEELAFEVTNEQALSVPSKKARELVRRGVRRVFCILVKSTRVAQPRVLEWSRHTDGWQPMPADAVIEDACLVVPIKARALIDAAMADETVARALLVKKNEVIEAALRDEHRAGTIEGRREGRRAGAIETWRTVLFSLIGGRGLAVDDLARARIEGETDPKVLERWVLRVANAKSVVDILE